MVLRVVAVVLFALLAASFWFFQIIQHAKFQEMAENNHQRELPLRAPRGVLFDRNGRVLVENRPSFNVSIVRLHTTNLDRTIRLLAAVAGTDERRMQELVDRHRHEPPYRPIVVIEDATLAQVAAITARRLEFELPDVVVQRVPTRNYPVDGTCGPPVRLCRRGQRDTGGGERRRVKSGDIIGQAGLEKTHNDLLMGTSGLRTVVVNSTGREMGELDKVEPVEGRRVKLTIDYDLQKAAEDGFKALGYQGAAVVLDPRNGEVLTFVSLPAYDPNRFAAGIDRATWAALNTDRLRPLQNRAIQGRYSPGSTFKIAVATAALEEGVATPDFRVHCSGRRRVLRALLQVPPEGRPRHGRHAARDREVVQRVLLHARQHAGRGSHAQVGDTPRARRAHRHRSAERSAGHHAVDGVEEGPDGREVVCRRDDLGGHRAGTGLGDAAVARRDDGDGGQRRHEVRPAHRQGDRGAQRLEPGAGAGARRAVHVQAIHRVGAA